MDGVHAEAGANRKEYRCKYQDCRGRVHEGSHHQKQQVHNQKNGNFAVGQSQKYIRDNSRYIGKAHNPAHDGRHANHEYYDSSHLYAVQQNPP